MLVQGGAHIFHRCLFEPPTRWNTARNTRRVRRMAHGLVWAHRGAPQKTVLAWSRVCAVIRTEEIHLAATPNARRPTRPLQPCSPSRLSTACWRGSDGARWRLRKLAAPFSATTSPSSAAALSPLWSAWSLSYSSTACSAAFGCAPRALRALGRGDFRKYFKKSAPGAVPLGKYSISKYLHIDY